MNGIVKWFDRKRGYGFITTNEEKDYFFHKSGTLDQFYIPEQGDEVEFEFMKSEKGLLAFNVRMIDSED
jgi:CspA family cold shock protein